MDHGDPRARAKGRRSFRLGWPRRNRTENGRPESRQGTDRAAAEG